LDFPVRTKTPHLADRILEAAARRFARERFHEVRMEDIAAEAEVSKGTLYSYFEDKDAIYRALLARAAGGMIAVLEAAVERGASARAKLVAIVDAIIHYFDGEPHLFDLIQGVEVLSHGGVDFPWQQARDVSLRLVHEVFEEGRQSGAFAVRDPELGALLLLGSLRAVVRFADRPRPRRLGEQIVTSFLDGAASRQ
jgi:AcrR family transcriptional regulator